MPWEDKSNEPNTTNMAEDPWGSGDEPPRRPRRQPVKMDDFRNRRSNGGGGGGQPPRGGNDLEDLAKNAAGQASNILNRLGGGGVGFVLVVLLILYGATGIYQVQETQRSVETTFGQVSGIGQPGLNWHWPAPVGSRQNVDVSQRTLEVGGGTGRDEKLIVTGDKQLVSFPIKVVWQVDLDAPDVFLFAYGNPRKVIELAAETALRDNIGRADALDAVGPLADPIRTQITADVSALVASNDVPLGVRILRVDTNGTPQVPLGVLSSVEQIQQAEAEAKSTREVAQQFENRSLNEADGVAGEVLSAARQEVVTRINSGLGEANRLRQIYNAYRLAPESTIQRLYEDARRILLAEASIDATADELRLDQILGNLVGGGQ